MNPRKRVVVAAACRTPFGKFGGSLKDISIYDLSAHVMKGVLDRARIQGAQLDEIFWGVGSTAEAEDVTTPVVARQAQLKAGIPATVPSQSIDRACCSSTAAICNAVRLIRSGEIGVAIAGGVEALSRTPFVLKGARWALPKLGNVALEDPLFQLGYKAFAPVAVDAGTVALSHGITREMQDEYAVESQRRWASAQAEGRFSDELHPIDVKERGVSRRFDTDEFPRRDTTLEALARLPPLYGSPTVTAGNAPGLNDGASAILLMSEERARATGAPVLGYVVDVASIAIEPALIAEAPAHAIRVVLSGNGMHLGDVAVLEINEAFAAVVLTTLSILAENDRPTATALRARTNVNGGAIAIGHPNAATGARITMTALYELRRRCGRYAVSALCGGLAQGDAVLLEAAP